MEIFNKIKKTVESQMKPGGVGGMASSSNYNQNNNNHSYNNGYNKNNNGYNQNNGYNNQNQGYNPNVKTHGYGQEQKYICPQEEPLNVQPLPEGFDVCIDLRTRKVFYVNLKTLKSQWDYPTVQSTQNVNSNMNGYPSSQSQPSYPVPAASYPPQPETSNPVPGMENLNVSSYPGKSSESASIGKSCFHV